MTRTVQHPLGIVGRDSALAVCAGAVERAFSGSGGLLMVTGEPGIGKTTVLQAAVAQARARGCRTAWAACPEVDAVPTFWPIVRLLTECEDPRTRPVAEELRGGEREATGESRLALFERVASALQVASTDRPLVLVLDDVHWADPSSLKLLAFVVKQLRTARVLVMGSYRDTDVVADHPLLDLLCEPGTSGETVTLQGLSTEDVAALVSRVGGVESHTVAARIRTHTGGNPFFVLHVARLLEAEGRLAFSDSSLPLPLGVRAVLERRLARLSQPCHELLGAAGVIGARFDVSLLAEVSRSAVSTVRGHLTEAAGARLVQSLDGGTAFEFSHALVRATVSAQLSAARRAELHGRVADSLRDRPGGVQQSLAEIAHHELNAAGDRPATRGVEAAEAAGRHAVRARAFEQAAEHFARAIAACREPGRTAELRLALGDALLRSGDWDAAAAAFLSAAELGRHLGRGDLMARAALGIGADTGGFEVRLGDHRQLSVIDEALGMLADTHPGLRSRLLARRAVAATNLATDAERLRWSEEAVALAREVGDPRTLAYALSAWCDVKSGPSYVEERLDAAAEMLRVAEASQDLEAELTARRFRVVAFLERGDPEVHREIGRFAAVAEALDQPLYRWYVPLFRGMQALLHGDLGEADRLCAAAAALGAEAGSDNAHVLSATQAAAIALERGQLAALVAVYEASLAEKPWMQELPIARAMAPLVDVAGGRVDQARARLHRLAADDFASVPVDSEWLSTLSGIATAIVALQDEVSAAALYRVLRPHAGVMVVDGIAAACLDSVDYLLGRLSLILERTADATAHLTAATEQSRRLGATLLQAHAEHALAAALEASDRPRAVLLRRGAAAVLCATGAAPVPVFGPTPGDRPQPATREDLTRTGVFHREGAWWTLTFADRTTRLPDAKGLRDLHHLLRHPGTPVPATALHHAARPDQTSASHGIEVLDDRARAAYRRRLGELDADIDEATDMADHGRAERARDEREFLVAELSAATGLGGRSRRMGDDTDRARKAVTMRIRNAVTRIERQHPALARHLSLAVRTGSVCSYEPEQPVTWSL